MELLDVVSVDDIWFEYVILQNTRYAEKGICVIVDLHNFNWRLLKWVTPDACRKSVNKLLSFCYKEYRFHVVNKSYLLKFALKIIMPFLPQYIKDMVSKN